MVIHKWILMSYFKLNNNIIILWNWHDLNKKDDDINRIW